MKSWLAFPSPKTKIYTWWSNRRYGFGCHAPITFLIDMMTSSNGNIFRVTGHLCGEFTGPRWIPHKKASHAELLSFFELRLNKRLGKQQWGWWFETLSCPLWNRRNEQTTIHYSLQGWYTSIVYPPCFAVTTKMSWMEARILPKIGLNLIKWISSVRCVFFFSEPFSNCLPVIYHIDIW